jgi:hypothetical protein
MPNTKKDSPEANGKLKLNDYDRELARLQVDVVK